VKVLSRRGFAIGIFAGLLASPAANAASWEKLGERSVSLLNDHDVIPVTLLRGDFRKIKLKVRGNGIFINELVVDYAVGGVDRLPVRHFVKAGGETRVIDLRGGERIVRSVQLLYRRVPNGRGRAVVSAYGR
jgi:hypothetical protein